MGLTRARAWQIFDIDYKQAVRVITLTNITLSGGAPSTVDGVNLAQDDRVLVAGQGTASQNGIYIVTTLGTGSNGTWTRAVDGNQTGEIQAGMIVMVTEGDTYDDTQWKLITDDPITVGVTSLVFEQIGTSLAGNFLPTANATYTLGNATYQWKSLYVSGNTIYVGDSTITSNATGISLTSPGGAVFTVSGTSVANTIGNFGIVSATGNVQAGNLLTSGLVSATGTITGANITGSNFLTSGLISATATITGGNLQTSGTISATGNITGGNVNGGANVYATTHTGSTVSVSGSVTGGNIFTGGEISSTGRIQGANIIGGNLLTSGLISATGNLVAGNITASQASLTGNVTFAGEGVGVLLNNGGTSEGGQLNFAVGTSYTGTISGPIAIDIYQNKMRFFETTGNNRGAYIDFTQAGDLVSTNLLAGGGTPGGSNTCVQFNDDGVFRGNTQFTYNKVTNTLTVGNLSTTSNGLGTNILVGDDGWIGDINAPDTIGIKGAQSNGANGYVVFGNANGIALGRAGTGPLTYGGSFSVSGNIDAANVNASKFVGNLVGTSVSLSGSVTGGNVFTVGLISATGNVTGGNLVTLGAAFVTGNVNSGNVSGTTLSGNLVGTTASLSANVTGGNVLTGGLISATGNISGGNILGGANVNATTFTGTTASLSGNITGGNILTAGIISATGNITGGNIRGVNIDSTSADVAERYLADVDYPVGTVLVIGGTEELTQSTEYAQTNVVGTVSEQPALTMNRDLEGDHVVSLAFLGRVPCRVVGTINRGDMLVSSNIPGIATRMESYVPGAVLGKALESYASHIPGVIEIIVGRL